MLQDGFHPQAALRDDQLYSYALGDYRVYFRSAAERIEGLAVDDGWVQRTLRPQVEEAMGMTVSARQQTVVYGGAIALVLVILSAGVALLFRDVTRESRTNQLRADFVSSVSHELKTPITLIRLYGDTLLERGELSASERAEFYRIIVRESERLTRLINQILTFSRIERGVEEYALEVGDLGRAVGRIMDDYEEYLQQAGFAMHREMATSLPPTRFDAIAVFQAVANLMDNAVKYSGESREITVRLGAREGGVVFEVEDKGIGIPSTEQMKIFDRFYRVQNGSGKGGYGLGLFLVRHVMEAHAGRVEVQSEVRRGSCFRLVFPLVTSS
jgi:signal transduction histidine kinase